MNLLPLSFLPDVFLSACFDKTRLVRWVKFWFLVLLTKIHMSGAFPSLRYRTAVPLLFWLVCCQAFAPPSLRLSVTDGNASNLSPFRQTTQALGLLEHLAQDQAASVALRLRDPYLGWLCLRCPCSPVGFPVEPSGAGQSGHALWERFTSLGLQQCQSWHPDWRTQMAVDDCCRVRVSSLQPVYCIVF